MGEAPRFDIDRIREAMTAGQEATVAEARRHAKPEAMRLIDMQDALFPARLKLLLLVHTEINKLDDADIFDQLMFAAGMTFGLCMRDMQVLTELTDDARNAFNRGMSRVMEGDLRGGSHRHVPVHNTNAGAGK